MRILVVSDIHGSLRAGELIRMLEEDNNFDKIFILGDFLYNGPRNKVPEDYNPNALIDIFNAYKDKIVAVRGNCDADVDLMVLNFSIPKTKIIKIKDHSIYLTHGDDESIFNEPINPGEILIKGHTHVPLMHRSSTGGIILNPGSMTFPKGKLNKSYMILDDFDIKLVEFDYVNNHVQIKNTYSFKNENF